MTNARESAAKPRSDEPIRDTIVHGARRIAVERLGARLNLSIQGGALREDQARIIAMRYLAPGERLLDRVQDTATSGFTFVVWPRA